MSIARLLSRAQAGTEAPPVTIEVFLSGGLPVFNVVGMPETAVRESKDRVRGALISSGYRFPQQRITASLGPADMRKAGGRYDLAIALGVLLADGQLRAAGIGGAEFYGELALNGELRPVPGILPAAIKCRDAGRTLYVPRANASEAALVSEQVVAATTLLELCAHLSAERAIPFTPRTRLKPTRSDAADLADVRGQTQAKRALEVAAAGGHHLLMVGPPGTGKSMLAERLAGILPPMSDAEALQAAAVDSVLGIAPDLDGFYRRPFRAPHHTASAVALVGGGADPRPGEISRAHNGVLFLDELPEFSRNVLEVLREPLEAGRITISRARQQLDFPARVQLVAAMNPCPCGYHGDPGGDCRCSADRVQAYRGRVSGPLLDRIDLRVEVGRPPLSVLRNADPHAETSRTVRRRVVAARRRQLERAGICNAALAGEALERDCALDADGLRLLERAARRFRLSVRAWHRALRVARTIADLDAATAIRPTHVAEALSLRGTDPRAAKPGIALSGA